MVIQYKVPAWAAIVALSFYIPGADAAICGVGVNANELSLQQTLKQRLSSAPNVGAACIADGNDANWTIRGQASATILLEASAYAGDNQFGIYDAANAGRQLALFGGIAGAGESRTINFAKSGTGMKIDVRGASGALITSDIFSSDVFGFYLKTPQYGGQIYFSNTALNSDGTDHLRAYNGNGGTFLNDGRVPLSLRRTLFDPGMALLAWEDLLGGGDRDFQDMVVLMKDVYAVSPVPLPATFALLLSGLGLLRFAGGGRRNRFR